MIRNLICSMLAGCFCTGALAAGKTGKRVEVQLKNAGDSVVAIWYAVGGERPRDRDMKTLPLRNGRLALDVPRTDSVYEVLFYPVAAVEKLARKRPGRRGWVPEIKTCRFYLFPGENARVRGMLSDSIFDWRADSPLYAQKYKAEAGAFTDYRMKEYRGQRQVEILLAGNAPQEQVAPIFEETKRWKQARWEWEQAWLEKNPDEELAGLYLLQSVSDNLDSLYSLLGTNVRNGKLKPLLDNKMDLHHEYLANVAAREQMKAATQMPAPDFTLPDEQGKPFTLSSLYGKGKYTVLDFWGMWCGWCVKGIPQMKEAYEKYKGRVEFVGVDCNDTEAVWRKGLEQHAMPWIGVWTGKERSVQTAYGVHAFPTKIVIDPAGQIVRRFEGEGEEFYRYLDSLFGSDR